MLDVDIQKLKRLFQEKRYSEVVFEIEASTTEKIDLQHYIIFLESVEHRRKAKQIETFNMLLMILKPPFIKII